MIGKNQLLIVYLSEEALVKWKLGKALGIKWEFHTPWHPASLQSTSKAYHPCQ